MPESRYLLAIDGGQTATKALAATPDGTVLAGGRGGPSDHFHTEGGVEKNRRAIHGAIDAALTAAGATAAQVTAIGLGLTGAPPEGDQNPVVQDVVQERLPHLPRERIVVEPDYKTNLLGASGGKPGIVLIAGGGGIGYGITADGQEAISGGFGYLIGDEGSAFAIGLGAIAAACQADDRRGEPTALEGVVREHFGVERLRDLPRVVYRAGFSRDQISLLTPKVVEVARAGDEAARAILAEAGRAQAAIGLGVLRQLHEPGEAATLYLTGGVFQAGDLVLNPFTEALHAGWPEATADLPRFPPAVGALILAAHATGIAVDEIWLDTVETTLHGIAP